ncbi:MAG TPA: hypothetical protein VNT22_06815 [Baekduia sp.]|nr:hypothetical protein [Baekduia sp.]
MAIRIRTYLTALLLIAAVGLSLFGIPALYVRQEVATQPALTDRLTNALQTKQVRSVAAQEAADGLIAAGATDLLTVRPLLVPAIEAFLGSQVVESATRLAARDAYEVIINRRDSSLVLDLGTASTELAVALRSISPKVARAVPADVDAPVLSIDEKEPALVAVRRFAELRSVGLVLPLAALATFAIAIAIAPRRRLALAWAGAGLAFAGGILAVTLAIAKALTVRSATEGIGRPDLDVDSAVKALWDAMLGDLGSWAISMIVVGGVTVIVGGAVISPSGIAGWLRKVATRVLRPRPVRAERAVRGAVAALVGLGLILDPIMAVRILLIGTGILVLFWGLAELTAAMEVRGQTAGRAPGLSKGRLALIVSGAALAIGAATVAAAAVTTGRETPPEAFAAPVAGCMGSKDYCGLRLNEVAIPATHNSFSAAEQPGWYFANQRFGIADQLADGIRGFLLDFHLGVRASNGRVRTDLEGEEQDRNRVAKSLSPQQLALAERLAGRLGAGDFSGRREVYLCHSVCELGAHKATDELKLIADFLKRNPGEIVTIFAEPYAKPAVIEKTFEEAGLLPYVARLDRNKPLPTLGEMVKSGERLVVFTERDGGSPDWYLDGFSFVQDTPLGATNAGQLRCTRNRGSADSPLLLINHWIDTFPPRPSANRTIADRFLSRRVEECAAARKIAPNLIAVDFYDQSGVVAVAAERNARAAQALKQAITAGE